MPVSCPADDADANAAALLLHAASAGADMAKVSGRKARDRAPRSPPALPTDQRALLPPSAQHSAGAGSSQPSGGFSIHSRGAGMGAGAGAVPLRPTPKHHVPSRTIQSIISTLSRNSANRGGPEMAQSLTGALATLESHLPATVMVPAWGQRRSSWLNKGKSARTIRDVATCLVDLDDAIAIPVRGATRGAAERKGWAMRMLNLHTYQTVSASVVSYLRDIEAAVAASGQCLIERCAPGPAAAATPETSDHHVPRPASAMSARSGPADGSGAAEEPALGRIGSVLASTRPAEATGRAPAGGSAAQGPDEAAVTPAGAEAREEAMKTPPPGTSVISGATRDGGVGAGASGETPAGGAGTEASTEPRGNGEGAAFVPRRGHKKMRLTETTPRPAYASGVGDSGREGSGRSPASGAARSRGTEERDEHVLSLPKDLRTRVSADAGSDCLARFPWPLCRACSPMHSRRSSPSGSLAHARSGRRSGTRRRSARSWTS